ncbi:MAG: ATP-binding cassette domain-containing protein [Nitriliruptorales bacterium]|nr:ATP-binding cassette domain-containing protein [Nitriliruptorales bacterium]
MSTTRPTRARAWTAQPAWGSDVVLALEEVSRSYGPTVALAPLTLRLSSGTLCLVHGPNGSGKTTLLRLAAGMLAPTTGRRHAVGRAVYVRSGDGTRAVQSPRQAVSFAATASGRDCDAGPYLAEVGLADVADLPAAKLSAGQRARVTLAVVLASRPAMVCMDEPTVHLDAEGRAAAIRVIRQLASTGTAVLVATHEDGLLSEVADARVCLRDGVVEAGPW